MTGQPLSRHGAAISEFLQFVGLAEKRNCSMKARNFDSDCDGGQDVAHALDVSKARNPLQEQKSVNVDVSRLDDRLPGQGSRATRHDATIHYSSPAGERHAPSAPNATHEPQSFLGEIDSKFPAVMPGFDLASRKSKSTSRHAGPLIRHPSPSCRTPIRHPVALMRPCQSGSSSRFNEAEATMASETRQALFLPVPTK